MTSRSEAARGVGDVQALQTLVDQLVALELTRESAQDPAEAKGSQPDDVQALVSEHLAETSGDLDFAEILRRAIDLRAGGA